MITWALIPVKRFNMGKSRLHEILAPTDLDALNRKLFHRTLSTCKESGVFKQVMVISEDPDALLWSMEKGCNALTEDHTGNLNLALSQALNVIRQNGGGSVLIIPTDLPLLSVEDLRSLAKFTPKGSGVLIVPDHQMTGTNALYLAQPDLMPTAFGTNSCAMHCALAEEHNLEQVIYLNYNIQHDLDTPEDLEFFGDHLN